MTLLSDLQIHINRQETFFLSQKIVSAYSGRLPKIIAQEKKKSQERDSLMVEIDDFPGGPEGLEMVSRFCYNQGRIKITVSNVCLLHCCAVFLGMNENVATYNLLQQTEIFLEGMFYWTWSDVLECLKSCESFFTYADSSGLAEKLISTLLGKLARNSESGIIFPSSFSSLSSSASSSSSSPDTASGLRFSPESSSLNGRSSRKQWWFNDLTILPPNIIEKVIKMLGALGNNNKSLVITRFLLHYLKKAAQKKDHRKGFLNYDSLAETAVYGVISEEKSSFSCRGLFCILRLISCFSVKKDSSSMLEKMIGRVLDEAKLDDLLVSGHEYRGVYDVKLVLRLIKEFVKHDGVTLKQMMKVGRLIDQYLREISPDQNLGISRFLAVAESLPDYARDTSDGVYRAVDIYLESHPNLSSNERSRLCRCLNFEKLSFEACKDLAKNPRVPPIVSVEALKSQKCRVETLQLVNMSLGKHSDSGILSNNGFTEETFSGDSEDMRIKLKRMQGKVGELEKVCREIKSRMSLAAQNIVSTPCHSTRGLPRLC